jgi:phosphoesterase RecJ-like protein
MMTHENPDVDGLGSMLALGKSLWNLGKEVVILIQKSLPPLCRFYRALKKCSFGGLNLKMRFDAVLALDCAEREDWGHA